MSMKKKQIPSAQNLLEALQDAKERGVNVKMVN